MEAPEYRLLKAVAKYLTDYCGEEARSRWEAKLSDKERERLARMSDPMWDAWTRLTEAISDVARSLARSLARLGELVSDALASVWANLVGPDTRLFGGEAF